MLDAVENFRFDETILGFLRERGIVDEPTLEWLADYRFRGDIWGYPEGEVYFPGSPVMRVEGTFAEAVLLETVILSILNHDSAIAAAASRMSVAAGGRPLIEMGARRTHELAAVAASRAAYVGGFHTTSDLAAGFRYNIPTVGTSAHAFTLLHDTERDAFTAQVESLGSGTTLLVDTYDVTEAVRTAVEVAGPELGAVRIDSGDLLLIAHRVRQQLDELGAAEDQDRGDQRPGRVRDRLAGGRAGGRVRRRHPAGDRQRAPDLLDGLQAGRPRRRRGARRAAAAGGEEVDGRQDHASAAASGPRAGSTRTGSPRPRSSAPGRSRRSWPTGSCWCRWSSGGEVVGREPLDAARDRHVAARGRAAAVGDPALPRRAGPAHRVRLTGRCRPRGRAGRRLPHAVPGIRCPSRAPGHVHADPLQWLPSVTPPLRAPAPIPSRKARPCTGH